MFKYIKYIVCFTLLGFSVPSIQAQDAGAPKIILRGKITDKKTKAAVQGASVTEVDADGRIIKGTASDIEGNYVLRVTSLKNNLNISYIGFKSFSQKID